MNTTTPNTPSAGGIHRGVWIGGGLMALTIIALATTLVVKNNDAVPDQATSATAAGTSAPLVAANMTPSNDPSSANQPAGTTPAPIVNESTRPAHYTPAPVHHATAHDNAPQQVAAAPVCASCGVVEGYSAVKIQGQNNGVGAVAGGLGGALVGSKIGGRGNHTVGGIVGAIGGGLLGNAIESHERTVTEYDVRVRMEDGSTRTVRQAAVPNVGQRVNVEGHTLHAIDGQG
ncbi:glycine zipper 2TM domain-containing protein [Scleromatobacter humisilvae]|uniref:Glycine zipper 2TM domain-containing protein n=1 Tax=Scleromatobacter humisilvae TaxID=2897159 RepID=A0A9X2C1H8_9BURK|nr:glycine zipper 2TM domain-containing protein [Scleromatobacter humisilvae]MCK9688818.1 glycine zipper 2TM domain-containing protein [Scleromatobacter humisilvae]